MKVPLLDLTAEYRTIQAEIDDAIRQVLTSGHFILGPNVKAFEAEVARHLSVKHAVGVASGTDALLLALRALGIGPGDEVIVPAYTFFATVGAVMLAGATPVFAEIEPVTYGLDASDVERRVTPRTKAIIPVHLYGHPADMTALGVVARRHGLRVIEDNAQAIGAEYAGQRTGGFSDIACLSFYPSKNLGAYGDAGMLLTNDAEVAERVGMLRTHGWRSKYFPEVLGYNSRLDELQAAILRVKLRHLDDWNDRRRALAETYSKRLGAAGISVPVERPDCRHVYHLYVIRVPDRDKVAARLQDAGIASAVYYPQPPYLAEPCRGLGLTRGAFPVSDQASDETLAIPLYPEMTDPQIEAVLGAVERAVDGGRPSR